jgi:ATP-dependent exoDNAse (exonuclease V) beta subunit
VLNVVDGCIPSDLGTGSSAEIEEERRLLYVAMTRAKDSLHLITPQRFFTHGQARNGDRHIYVAQPLYPGYPAAAVRTRDLAGRCQCHYLPGGSEAGSHRCRRPHANDVAVRRSSHV